jgi:hypothetical protein
MKDIQQTRMVLISNTAMLCDTTGSSPSDDAHWAALHFKWNWHTPDRNDEVSPWCCEAQWMPKNGLDKMPLVIYIEAFSKENAFLWVYLNYFECTEARSPPCPVPFKTVYRGFRRYPFTRFTQDLFKLKIDMIVFEQKIPQPLQWCTDGFIRNYNYQISFVKIHSLV